MQTEQMQLLPEPTAKPKRKSVNKPCTECGGSVCVHGTPGRTPNVRVCDICGFEEPDR